MELDFIIIGPQKTGSSALHNYFSQHTEIAMSSSTNKETHFFDNKYKKGKEYLEKFFIGKENFVKGTQDPSYFHYPDVPWKIQKMFPNIKLIILIRDPIKRAYSHYWANRRYCRETLSFYEAIENEVDRVKNNDYTFAYKLISLYPPIISDWLRYFSRKQLFIMRSSDLRDKPQETLRKVCKFLNISMFTFEKVEGNRGGAPRNMVLGQCARVCAYLDIEPLRNMLMKWNTKNGFPVMDDKSKKYLENYFEGWEEQLLDVIGEYDS